MKDLCIGERSRMWHVWLWSYEMYFFEEGYGTVTITMEQYYMLLRMLESRW
jgi:hypothetical protein